MYRVKKSGKNNIREMPPDVAQRRRAEQRIADRVQQHIRVRMSEQAFFVRDLHPADDQLAAFHQLMHVVALTDPHGYFPW